MVDSNERTNSATDPIMAKSCWCGAMRLTVALPTMTSIRHLEHEGLPLFREAIATVCPWMAG
jgi:hypothetical protein